MTFQSCQSRSVKTIVRHTSAVSRAAAESARGSARQRIEQPPQTRQTASFSWAVAANSAIAAPRFTKKSLSPYTALHSASTSKSSLRTLQQPTSSSSRLSSHRLYSIMAGAVTPATDLHDLLRQYYPSTTAIPSEPSKNPSKEDLTKISTAIFPDVTYSEAEQDEIANWVNKAKGLALEAQDSPELKNLNLHLSTRTTILGGKPSVADAVLYAALTPQVRGMSPEQRTGEAGHHHIIRYVDFVQSAPLLKLSIPDTDKIPIDPDDILFVPKTLDPKEEKERKKKEKAAAAAASAAAAGETAKSLPTRGAPADKLQQAKEVAGNAAEAVKSKGAELAAAAGIAGGAQKKEKKQKQKGPVVSPLPEKPLGPNLIDLRIGHILKCEKHPDADSLYVSTMDVGDAPGTKDTWMHEETKKIVRTVCSGLNGLVPLESMQGRRVVAVCNLKPVKMRGILSCAMVLAASPRLPPGAEDNHAGPVELVEVPAGPPAGTRVSFEGFEGEPEGQLNPKKKVWEAMQIGFTTLTEDGVVAFERGRTEVLAGDKGEGKPTVSKLVVQGSGPCTVPTLKDAVVR